MSHIQLLRYVQYYSVLYNIQGLPITLGGREHGFNFQPWDFTQRNHPLNQNTSPVLLPTRCDFPCTWQRLRRAAGRNWRGEERVSIWCLYPGLMSRSCIRTPYRTRVCVWKWAVRSRNGSFKGDNVDPHGSPISRQSIIPKTGPWDVLHLVTHYAGLEARKDPWHHAWGVREASDWWRIAEMYWNVAS